MSIEKPSLEAVEDLAHRLVTDRPVLRGHKIFSHYERALKTDRSLAILIARAHVKDQLEPITDDLAEAWRTPPLALPMQDAFTPASLQRWLESETNGAKRQALQQLADERAKDTFAHAREAVQTLRELHQTLQSNGEHGLFRSLGLTFNEQTVAVAQNVLAVTNDAFVEADLWALKQSGIETPRRSLRWEERVHTLFHPRAAGLIAMGDRPASCLRWVHRCGLQFDHTLLQEHIGLSRHNASGIILAPSDRVRVFGEENCGLRGTLTIANKLGCAISYARGWAEVQPRHRWGADQVAAQTFAALVEQTAFTESFAHREFGVDRSQLEWITRAGLHTWLYELRSNAALALFAHDVLNEKSQLSERYRELMFNSVACAQEPSWTVHQAANILADCAETKLWGQLFGAWAGLELREKFEEDWFRNPLSGERLTVWLDDARLNGTEAWFRGVSQCEADDSVLDVLSTALTHRVRELCASL